MQNFDWTKFTKRIAINSSQQTIYDAWTLPSETEKWFLSSAKYYDINGKLLDKNQRAERNCCYAWNWFLYAITETGKIIEANGKDLFQFTFAGNCMVKVSLKTNNQLVVVELTQWDIPTDEKSKKNIRLGCDSGWSFFLVNLKSVYEGGIDLRNRNESLKGMINN